MTEQNQNSEIEINDEPQIIQDPSSSTEENIEDGSYPKFDYENLTDEEKERIDEINDLLKAEKLDTTTAMNILINAVQVSYDKEHFNDLDRYLIVKSLTTFKDLADNQEDIIIKTV
jgi:hypothetical protein